MNMNWMSTAVIAAALFFSAGAPAGSLSYAVAGSSDGFAFGVANLPGGSFMAVGAPLTSQVGGIGFGADRRIYGLDAGNNLVRIDAATGAVTTVGYSGIPLLSFQPDAAIVPFASCDGGLYGVDVTNTLNRFDPKTGAASAIGSTGIPFINIDSDSVNEFNGLAVSGGDIYFSYQVFNVDENFTRTTDVYPNALYRLDRKTGLATKVMDLPTLSTVFSGDDRLLYGEVLNPDYTPAGMLIVDPHKAKVTTLAPAPAVVFFSAVQPRELPHPRHPVRRIPAAGRPVRY